MLYLYIESKKAHLQDVCVKKLDLGQFFEIFA